MAGAVNLAGFYVVAANQPAAKDEEAGKYEVLGSSTIINCNVDGYFLPDHRAENELRGSPGCGSEHAKHPHGAAAP